MINKIIGIVSYLPDKEPDRTERISRLNRLLSQLDSLFPCIPIMIIAQNWKAFKPIKEPQYRFDYNKLGILKARQELRIQFLKTNADYIIMSDDDAIISCSNNNASLDYLSEIDKHPDGFCFLDYAASQLNMCAISSNIYEKEPLPDHDPQKSEAFEDRIYSMLLHVKYADKEFKAPPTIKCIHFKNPNEIAPSTWAREEKYDWKQLTTNTANIEEYIKLHGCLPFFKMQGPKTSNGEIELVVPYVDCNDSNWQALFKQYNPTGELLEEINGIERFRGQGDFFKYFFRCIEKNLPWVDKIHLLVQSESQVPSWIDKDKVYIVLHKDFIPEQYLPTFNSTCIEMFLPFIPNLGEEFLYANDDMFVIKPLSKELFFKEGKVRNASHSLYCVDSMYGNHVRNTFNLVYNTNNQSPCVPGFDHCTRPYFKSELMKCYSKFEQQIKVSISRFREPKNLNVYLYDHFIINEGKQLYRENITTRCIDSHMPNEDIIGLLCTPIINMLCIEDSYSENIYRNQVINNYFKSYYPKKSKYEL